MNVFVLLGILVVNWSLDSSDPDVARVVTRVFLAVHALLLVTVVYIFARIWRRADRTLVHVPATSGESSSSSNTITDENGNKLEAVPHWQYDLLKLRDLALGKVIVPGIISVLVSRRLHMPFPLLLQAINNPTAVWQSPLCQIHVRGRDGSHDAALTRPWPEATLVPSWVKDIWRESERESAALLARSDTGGSNARTSNSAATTTATAASKASRRRR